ncbi:MAG: translation initiation factor IF-6 [Candidatus Aenigmatarchaeota archaeon]
MSLESDNLLQTNFFGDHNLGLYGKACDRICVLGKALEEKREKIEDVLKVKTVALSFSSTDFAGIFCALNENGIVLTKILTSLEKEKFFELKKLFGMNLLILKSKFTAVGNLVLCNGKGAIVSELLSKKEKKEIEDCLGLEAVFSSIAGIKTVGACGIATNKGCLLHRDASEEEIKTVEDVLKVRADIGTANFGSPFVGSCIIANSKGALVGESTTGPEIARIQEALGFI